MPNDLNLEQAQQLATGAQAVVDFEQKRVGRLRLQLVEAERALSIAEDRLAKARERVNDLASPWHAFEAGA